MVSFLIGLLFTLAILISSVILFIYIVIPVIGHIFTFVGRLFRFAFQEIRDILLVPLALFICLIKLLRAMICIVFARWDIVSVEIDAAKRRFLEAYNRTVSVFIDNPLRLFGIDSVKQKETPDYVQQVRSEIDGVIQEIKHVVGENKKPENKFKGYTVVGTLPPGGSGAKLYITKPHNGSSRVVIKCFDISDGSALPQIVRESRSMEAAKKLGLIIEHHLDNERFWYAMPFHDGDHLGVVTTSMHGTSSNLNNKNLRTILLYQQTLLQTLREYHLAGLWHKDVKPDNIIVHNNRAHLVDLGLVIPLASAMTLTTHGTEYFRDPELVRQAMRGVKVHQVDGSKFDVYSAGAVLYFMLENTFPPHGGLSGFSKNSPECIRWVVRRAMADYDKRYVSVEEMLADIETILYAKDVSRVRPADLPSMNTKSAVLGNVVSKKSVRPRTTPSTGGGPFKQEKNKTKPVGILAAFIIGAMIVYATTSTDEPSVTPEFVNTTTSLSIFDHQRPGGRVLLLENCAMASNPKLCGEQVSEIVEKLITRGWDIVSDQQLDARARVWMPEEINNITEVALKLEHEQLSGIIVFTESANTTLLAKIIEPTQSTTFAFSTQAN